MDIDSLNELVYTNRIELDKTNSMTDLLVPPDRDDAAVLLRWDGVCAVRMILRGY